AQRQHARLHLVELGAAGQPAPRRTPGEPPRRLRHPAALTRRGPSPKSRNIAPESRTAQLLVAPSAPEADVSHIRSLSWAERSLSWAARSLIWAGRSLIWAERGPGQRGVSCREVSRARRPRRAPRAAGCRVRPRARRGRPRMTPRPGSPR